MNILGRDSERRVRLIILKDKGGVGSSWSGLPGRERDGRGE